MLFNFFPFVFVAAVDSVLLMGIISLVTRDQEHNMSEVFGTAFGATVVSVCLSAVLAKLMPGQLILAGILSSIILAVVAIFAFNAILATDMKRATIISLSFCLVHTTVTGILNYASTSLLETTAKTYKEAEQTHETSLLENFLGPPMLAQGPEGTWLSGVQVSTHEFGIQSLFPVYVSPSRRLSKGITYGTPVETVTKCYHRGYAVTLIEVKQEYGFEAIRFTFMKIKDDGSGDPEDIIEDDWVGQTESDSKVTEIGEKGTFLVGFKCFADEESVIHIAPLDE